MTSNLGAQLASLNNLKYNKDVRKNPSDSTNIGRGIQRMSNVSLRKSTPSIIMTSRKAADVSVTTLRENCVRAMELLEDQTGNVAFRDFSLKLADEKSLQFERGLSAKLENDALDEHIKGLLGLLSTCLSASLQVESVQALHVLEFVSILYYN